MKKQGIIIGASKHSGMLLDVLRNHEPYKSQYEVRWYLDDNQDLWGTKFNEIEIAGGFSEIESMKNRVDFVLMGFVSINYMRERVAHIRKLNALNLPFVDVIHPSSIISKEATLGNGIFVAPNVIINAKAQVGNHVTIYTGTTIDHDCIISDNSFIAPGVNLGGAVSIGKGAYLGIGASIMDGIRIGDDCVVGAGAVIINDVPRNQVVAGVPGRILKSRY